MIEQLSNKKIEEYRRIYEGKRIEMLKDMDDPQPILAGEKGTVVMVDSMGQLHMKWDSGRTLAVLPTVDSFRIINE